MITDRDEKALRFISDFQILTTNHIDVLVYNNRRVCQRRLEAMIGHKLLYRCKNLYSKEFVYSTKPINTKQLKHKLIRVDFYMALLKSYDVSKFLIEPHMNNLRPDALVICSLPPTSIFFALEVECSNNTINTLKYEKFITASYDQFFKASKNDFKVVYITDKVIPKTSFNVVKIKPDLSNISDIFKTKGN